LRFIVGRRDTSAAQSSLNRGFDLSGRNGDIRLAGLLTNLQVSSSDELSRRRATSPSKLRKRLQGDLDNIILMALRKDPARRYQSAEQFAEDLRRHLDNVPVKARNDTVWYRTSRFLSRHKAGLVASAAVGISLVVGLGVAVHEARIARVQRTRAERRFDDVRSLANSLIFDVHDSIRDLPGSTPARKIIVDRALKYLNGLAQESSGDISLQRELAAAYERVGTVQGDYLENNLGDPEGTLDSYQKSLQIRKQIDASSSDWNDHVALARGYRLVAHQMWTLGNLQLARSHIANAIATSETVSRSQPRNVDVLYELSFDYEVSGDIGYPGDPAATSRIVEDYRKALAADEVSLQIKPDDIRVLHGYSIDVSNIGGMLEASDPRAALQNYQKGLEINQRLTQLSTDLRFKRAVAIAYGSIASAYDNLGDYNQAAENNLKDLTIYKQLVEADPKNVLLRQGLAITYANASASLNRLGKTRQAVEYSGTAVEIMRALVAASPKNTRQKNKFAATLVVHGTNLKSAKEFVRAAEALESARSIYESLFKAGAVDSWVEVGACDVKLGENAALAGKDQAAVAYFRSALSIMEPLIAKNPPNLDALYGAADAYSGLGDLGIRAARGAGKVSASRRQSLAEARSWYTRSRATWRRIEHPNHTAPNSFQVGDPSIVEARLKEVDLALDGTD